MNNGNEFRIVFDISNPGDAQWVNRIVIMYYGEKPVK